MTVTEYAYTEQDIYTAIVQTAVPIALTADETALLVADLIALAETMPHDGPAGVFHAYRKIVGTVPTEKNWRGYLVYRVRIATAQAQDRAIARSAVLARQAAEYPSLKR